MVLTTVKMTPLALVRRDRTVPDVLTGPTHGCPTPTPPFNASSPLPLPSTPWHAVTEDDEDIGHLWPDDIETCFFLDSADLQEWDKWAPTGFFHGFTTNPTILRRDNVRCTLPSLRELTRQATSRGAVELQLQAWGSTDAELYSRALDLYELEPSMIVVKLPMTMAGLKAAYRLVDDEVPFTLTAVHSVHQVPVAIAAGAAYIAPYLGRMTDSGKDVSLRMTCTVSPISLSPCHLLASAWKAS